MKINKFYASAVAAYLIWGFFPIPLKELSAFQSSQILYFRIIFSCICLIFIPIFLRRKNFRNSIQVFKDSEKPERKKFVFLTVAGGILLTANWLAFIYAINHISIQTASFSYLICPIMTAILGFWILKEELSLNKWAAIIISGVSCFLVGTGSLLNLGFSLVIAFTYAFYLITQRMLKNYDKMFLLMLQLTISVIIIAPFYNVFNSQGGQALNLYFFSMIAIISIFFTVIPLFLSLYALKEIPSGTMGILMYINPVMNFAVAFLFYQEKATPNQLMAYFLISVSLILYNIKFRRVKVAT